MRGKYTLILIYLIYGNEIVKSSLEMQGCFCCHGCISSSFPNGEDNKSQLWFLRVRLEEKTIPVPKLVISKKKQSITCISTGVKNAVSRTVVADKSECYEEHGATNGARFPFKKESRQIQNHEHAVIVQQAHVHC